MRARNIKPGLYENEVLGRMSPLAHLLFPYLWMECDWTGRMEYRPLRVKAKAFPYRDANIDELCNELEAGNLIDRYGHPSCEYWVLEVKNFTKHQNPCKKERETPSKLPQRDSVSYRYDPSTVPVRSQYGTGTILVPLITDSLILISDIQVSTETESASPPAEKTADAEQRAILAARRRKVIDTYNPIAERNDWFVVDGKPNGTAMDLLNKFCEDEYRFGKLDEYMNKVAQSTMEACRINVFLTKRAFNNIMAGNWCGKKEDERKGAKEGSALPQEAIDLSKPWNRPPEPEKRPTGIWDSPEGII